jgi:hypothetical protein
MLEIVGYIRGEVACPMPTSLKSRLVHPALSSAWLSWPCERCKMGRQTRMQACCLHLGRRGQRRECRASGTQTPLYPELPINLSLFCLLRGMTGAERVVRSVIASENASKRSPSKRRQGIAGGRGAHSPLIVLHAESLLLTHRHTQNYLKWQIMCKASGTVPGTW